MDESMILACKAMDGSGIPAAVVKVQVDRFLFANECFLQVTGLTVADLSSTSLLKIVSFPLKYRLESKPIPVTIRSFNQSLVVRGHLCFGKQGLACVITPSRFHQTIDLDKEQEWQRPATYRRSQLTPELIALDFSIEFVRAQLRVEKNRAEPDVEEIRDILRVSKPG
jgi:hypothetical protein